MFVVAQVSSMKTSFSGSRSSWPMNHAWRRFRMSGRSCSLAWAVFFPGNAVAVEEAPQRANAKAVAPLSQLRLKLLEGDVAGLIDDRQDQLLVRNDAS
jgi:hypothetical protein